MFCQKNHHQATGLNLLFLYITILIGTHHQQALIKGTLADNTKSQDIEILMPNVRPNRPEQYLCASHRVPVERHGHFIVGIKPHGDSHRVHHMLLYGCREPGLRELDTPNVAWDCGSMHSTLTGPARGGPQEKVYAEGPVCRGEQHILYGWGLDAPPLKLPEGVGFKVGGIQSDIKWLVLQVHYGHTHVFQELPNLTDNSGLVLSMRPNLPSSGITKQAGVMLLASLGEVPMGKSRHEIWCDIEDNIEIHPFRFRVHTHKLGTKVLGAKLSRRKSILGYEIQDDRIIGKGDPQKPQTFYPVKDKDMVIGRGDTVYAYCEFNNNRTHTVKIGQTGMDEMCNFYLMYWTDSPRLLTQGNCLAAQ